MDALQLLRDDHRRVKELFRQFDAADDASTRKAIADEAIAELMVHAQIEEEVFYPAMQRAGLIDQVAHAEEEHHAAETIMNEVADLDARDGTLPGRFSALVDAVREHIDEEESQLFPRAAELGMGRLERIGDELTALKERILKAAPAERRRPRATGVAATRKRTVGTAKSAKAATTRAAGKAKTTARKVKSTARKVATTARKTTAKATTSARKKATTVRAKSATAVRKTTAATTNRTTASSRK